MFPLTLLPLPGELVPLHIFEPRYKQLLQDAESSDIHFGIYCTHEVNVNSLGSAMSLESLMKTYPGGEADIVVKCHDIFTMSKLMRTYKSKLYPGGDVTPWEVDAARIPGAELYELFMIYLRERKIQKHSVAFSIYQIASELSLDVSDRYKFLTMTPARQEAFLLNHIRYQHHLLNQEEKSRDMFHLN